MGRRRSLSFVISPAEWDLLVGEPAELFLVYCQIRMFMDYESRISGAAHPFEEAGLCEVLEVEAVRGRAGVRPSRQKLRSVIDRLVSLGALVRRLDVGPLVFFLPHAVWDKSVQMNRITSTTKQQPDQQPETEVVFSSENNAVALVAYENSNQTRNGGCVEQQPITVPPYKTLSDTPVVTVESIGVDPGERMNGSAGWFEFFSRRCGVRFEHRKLHTAKNGRLFEGWVARGVCVGDVLRAMELAHGRRGGAPPDSPAYYGWAVDSVLSARAEGGADGSRREGGRRRSGADILADGCADAFW